MSCLEDCPLPAALSLTPRFQPCHDAGRAGRRCRLIQGSIVEQIALAQLIEQCARVSSGGPDADAAAGACAEIIRRGLGSDAEAWRVVRRQYTPLVRAWREAHPLSGEVAENDAAFLASTFDRFRQIATAEAGTDLATFLRLLTLAVFSGVLEEARADEARPEAEPGSDLLPLSWEQVAAALPEPAPRLALYLTAVADLRPQAIARRRPDVFPSAATVYSALGLALTSLRADPALAAHLPSEATGAEPPSACVQPGAVDDEALIAAASGELGRRVREHLQSCPRCAALVAAYQRDLQHVRARLFRADCPTPLELGRHALDQEAPERRAAITAHLAGCSYCAAELATATGYLDAPAAVSLGALGGLRRLVALPLPVREGAGRRWRAITLRYTAAEFTLTLHPQPATKPKGRLQLLGFVERAGATLESLGGGQVRLLHRGTVTSRATLDEIGSFSLGPVEPGSYDLEIATSAGTLVVPSLRVSTEY